MQNNRLENLLLMVENTPADPFLHYAIALEQLALGDHAAAKAKFDYLLAEHPDYLPLYYQYGLMLSEFGETEKALAVLQKGVALAEERKDWKTLGELREVVEGEEE